jgi:signal transduction histidine kinase
MTATVSVTSLLGGLLACLGLSLCGLGVYTYRRRSTPGTTWFARLLGVLGGGTLAAAAVGFTAGFDGFGWLGVLYAVVLLTPVPWIGFVVKFTGRGGLLGPRRLTLLSVPLLVGVVITFVPTFVDTTGPAFLVGTLVVFFYGVMLVFVGAALLIRTTYLYAHLSVLQGVVPAVALAEPWFFLTVLFQPIDLSTELGVGIGVVGMGLTAGLLAASVLWLGLLETAAAAGNIGTETVVEEIDEMVIVVDDGHRIVTLNNAARDTLDLARPDGLGAKPEEVFGYTVDTLRESRTVDLFTATGYRTFETGVSVLSDQHGREFGAVITLADVTEREIREGQLRVLNRVLRHNLRNEMDVIHALAGNDNVPGEIGRQIKTTANELLETSERAREAEQLMETSSLTPSAVDIGDVTASVVADVRERYPEVTVEATVRADQTVHTDRTVLTYVLSNLIENAAEHNDADAPEVSVTVADAERDGAELVEITVGDNGPGIADRERQVIEAGEETELRHGSGLGLWTAKWGSRILGGRLRFDPNHPRGTVVSITLPVRSGRGPGGQTADS